MNRFYPPKTIMLAVLAALAVSATATYAFRMVRKTNTRPNPTLAMAYAKPLQALGSETNAFYCVSARSQFITESAGPTEWHLVFYSTNGQVREVIIPTSENVIVHDKLQHEY